MIFNNNKKRPPVINGAHLHGVTLMARAALAFSEPEGRWARMKRSTSTHSGVAGDGDKRRWSVEGERERERRS